MDGRKRTVQLKFRVTEAERDLILEKMKLIPTRNMAAYLRKIAIDDRDVVPFDVVQVTCDQHRDGCLSGSSLLRGESHVSRFVHTVIHFNRYT